MCQDRTYSLKSWVFRHFLMIGRKAPVLVVLGMSLHQRRITHEKFLDCIVRSIGSQFEAQAPEIVPDNTTQCFRSTVSRVHSFEFSWIYFNNYGSMRWFWSIMDSHFLGPSSSKSQAKTIGQACPVATTTYSIYFYFYDLLILSLQNNNTEGLTLRKRTFKITILKKRSSTRQKRITKGLNSLVTPTYIFSWTSSQHY